MKEKCKYFRVFLFLCLFVLFFYFFSHVVSKKWPTKTSNDYFYEQPKDSIDVLFIGASGYGTGVSPLILWEEAGIAGFTRAVGAQQASMMYYYLLESLKYQNPDVVVLDAYRLVRHLTLATNESAYRRAYETLPISDIKLRALFDITSDTDFNNFISFLFPFFRYHSRWADLEQKDFVFNDYDSNYISKGQSLKFTAFPAELPEDFMTPVVKEANIHFDELLYFEKMIQLCRDRNIDVFLMVMPRLSRADYSEYVAVKNFAEDNQLLFIDYNLPELMSEVNFDPGTDMLDKGHVNPCGAVKFSRHLAEVLKNNFSLPDRRNDPDYLQWHSDLEKLKELILQNCNQ